MSDIKNLKQAFAVSDSQSIDKLTEKPAPYFSLERLTGTLSKNNSVMIDGDFYQLPEGTDLKQTFGEPVYASIADFKSGNTFDPDGLLRFPRERNAYESADLLSSYGCLLAPTGEVYKLPEGYENTFEHVTDFSAKDSCTKDIWSWCNKEAIESGENFFIHQDDLVALKPDMTNDCYSYKQRGNAVGRLSDSFKAATDEFTNKMEDAKESVVEQGKKIRDLTGLDIPTESADELDSVDEGLRF